MKHELPQKFIERMEKQLGDEFAVFLAQYDKEPVRGLRVNTLKLSTESFLELSGYELVPTDILTEGFCLKGELKVKNDPYHFAGLYYMQEPSAMSAVAAARIKKGMNVLDLCAAPGGKSSSAAAHMQGEGLLVSNEIVPSRAKVLAGNLERLGIVNSVVTSAHPDKLCSALDGFFDVVLVDAPCSGEGMFRRDETAIEEWSQEHVEACALRQKAILESAQQAVKGGGALIYSTCTFSEEENERVIRWFLETYPDFELEFMHRLYPHTSKGEGHFVARLVRNFSKNTKRQASMQLRICKDKEYEKFMKEAFIKVPDAVPYLLNDGRVILLSSFMPEMLKKLRIISSGVEAGEMLSNRFAPSHSLFMAAYGCEMSKKVSFNRDDEALMRFLKGETTECDNDLKGYCAVAVDGYNIGFGKACCGIVKNHIPKGLRII